MLSSEFYDHKSNTDFELTLLQKGGTCTIFRTLIHNKYHVIKRINQENCKNPIYIESLRREFEISFPLDHQSIVRTIKYDLDEEGGSILMEFIDGLNLNEFVKYSSERNKSVDWKSIFIQLCDALAYLHVKQVYHLDLKPENIMITARSQRVKIIDFGHAAMDGNLSDWGGTKGYMPPERNKHQFSSSNDIYALGKVIEYCMQFESKKISNQWENVIKACLKEQPDQRIDSMESLEKLIQKIGTSLKYSKQIVLVGFLVFIGAFVFFYFRKSNPINHEKSLKTPVIILKEDVYPKNYSKLTNNSPYQVNTIEEKEIYVDSHVIFTKEDSVFLLEITSSLYDQFTKQRVNLVEKTVGNDYKLLNKIRDSISTQWNNFVSSIPENSLRYRRAYQVYYKNITENTTRCAWIISKTY